AGVEFVTETDTETVALMTHRYMTEGADPVEAAKKTLARLEGAFALAFLFDGYEDLMIAARKGSPLAIGYGTGEMFVGSDAIALSPLTDRISYLEEGDIAVITRTSVEVTDANGNLANRAIRTIQIDATRIDKGGHKHFMAKEIAEQPGVIGQAISHYLSDRGEIMLPDSGIDFTQVDRITMVACGTASYACLTAKYWFEQIARIPVEVDVASEFRYREPPIPDRTLAVFVSQSGETADTLAALRYCDGKAQRILSVINVPESSIARESDLALPIYAGVEVGVASTKAFTCQLTVLLLLVLKAAKDRGILDDAALADHISALRGLPSVINTALEQNDTMRNAAYKLSSARDVLFLGRGQMFPLALEGALKLKEISYIHAEAYASGELKHGPIALVDEDVPVVVLAPKDALFDKTVSNMQEVMARKGKVILVSDAEGLSEASDGVWESIEMPKVADLLAPILYAIPAQLLAYHTAVAKGTDVDQPRNLAKSVTVE
ncbi:MAG: glutamine--fructose-6-phosphate transaminase (isomerizing), partial [Sulfitobacter sp.]|nr:glutamine--fructose-6-phosphate transaminase (isomerizing) [Sulfitobacter sp.]